MSAEAGTLDDAEKLRVLAAWFDMWDETRYEDRQRLLDDERNPGRNDVQRDLRRVAASLAGTLDEAWAAAEAALPEGRDLGIRRMPDGSVYAWASTQPGTGSSSDTYQEGRDSGKGDSPAAALRALAAALRTPKPEGDR